MTLEIFEGQFHPSLLTAYRIKFKPLPVNQRPSLLIPLRLPSPGLPDLFPPPCLPILTHVAIGHPVWVAPAVSCCWNAPLSSPGIFHEVPQDPPL